MTLLDPIAEPSTWVEPTLPIPRGPRSEMLVDRLRRPVHALAPLPVGVDRPIDGDDAALALHLLYELHYRGFDGVDERWEWEPSLVAATQLLEHELEEDLVAAVGNAPVGVSADDVVEALDDLAGADGPSLSGWLLDEGTLAQVREFAIHRSIYQLKEADPHTFGIPRLTGRAKAAMVDIQTGEYGDGDPSEVHATLFARTMEELGLDARYGAHLDHVPAATLATGNLITYFGVHRRWRGALVGHLALFEMTSIGPMGRYAAALRRLGVGARGCAFYDVHVEADARHQVVGRDMARALAEDEPLLGGEIIFGARALTHVEGAFAAHLLACWQAGHTSLRRLPRSQA